MKSQAPLWPGWAPGPSSAFGWLQLRPPQRQRAIIGLAVEGAVAVVVAGYSFLSMFGEGPVQEYYDWVARPGLYAGVTAVACAAGCTIWLALPLRHVAPRAAIAAALSVGFAVGCLAVVTTYVRSSPEGALLAAVRQLVPPRGATNDKTTYGMQAPGPWDARGFTAELVATRPDQAGDWSPAAVRSWRVPSAPHACAQTEALALDWADARSVKVLSAEPARQSGLACQWSAHRRGWQALVEVVYAPGDPQLGDYAVFQVGTPGLWCCVVKSLTWCCG
jgi:hypothetical protein